MRDEPTPEAIDFIWSQAEARLEAQLRQADALDTKAGVLLGVIALGAGLAGTLTPRLAGSDRWVAFVSDPGAADRREPRRGGIPDTELRPQTVPSDTMEVRDMARSPDQGAHPLDAVPSAGAQPPQAVDEGEAGRRRRDRGRAGSVGSSDRGVGGSVRRDGTRVAPPSSSPEAGGGQGQRSRLAVSGSRPAEPTLRRARDRAPPPPRGRGVLAPARSRGGSPASATAGATRGPRHPERRRSGRPRSRPELIGLPREPAVQ